ncbi:MAG: hypothetical protein JXR12_05375 [Neptunomonas phycophila]|uniref:hypothetical protein n=1 Tax=Neptunomonas phycophila TaxID=1572645 RepID=UPI003B8B1FA9
MITLLAEVNGNVIEFTEQSDGWFSNEKSMLAISPDMSTCITDPWHADYITEAPSHAFQILQRP